MVRWRGGGYKSGYAIPPQAAIMKRLIVAGTAAATLLAAASCGGSRSSGQASGSGKPDPASYLAVSDSKVAFIQWRTTSRRGLDGTITEGNTGASAPAETLTVSSVPFIGTRSGNSVTLTFAGLYFLQTRAQGRLSGSTLTVQVPQTDGTVKQATFTQSDEASYNRAIAKLRGRIRDANELADQQQPGNAQDAQGAQNALAALYKDSSLAANGRLADGLARFADHIQTAQAHLAAEKQAAAGSDGYCVAAYRATGEAQTVDGSLLAVQGDSVAMMADIAIIRADIAAADAYLRRLSRAGTAAPSSAYGVVADAKVSLTQAIAKANAYIDQINAIDVQAHSIADNMATKRCSGARSGDVARPIPHIK
jgi:hypothetical protein